MRAPINILKIIQAACVLLKTEPDRRMSRMRLLKLLYIADREYLKERHRTITGDHAVAMDNGPVLSTVYAMIRGEDFCAADWEKHIAQAGAHDVELKSDAGVGKLSRNEIEKLQEVARRFATFDDWAISNRTHEFPEWQRNKPASGSSKPISFDDLLEALGMLDEKQGLVSDAQREAKVEQFFRAARSE